MSCTVLILSLSILYFSAINCEETCSHWSPCALKGGSDLTQPSEVKSRNGKLAFTLNVEPKVLTFDWLSTKRRTYNGSIPGPTWRLKPGDKVNVTLINSLTSTMEEDREMNQYRYPNHTNLHTHGLHISSEKPQDSVFIKVSPGESFTYEYELPEDHPPGTYWYHAHVHGSTFLQVLSGLAGMIIVDDKDHPHDSPFHYLSKISCPHNCDREVNLVFQPVLQYGFRGFANAQQSIDDDPTFRLLEMTKHNITLEDWLDDEANGVVHYTTNGLLHPEMEMKTEERKRFRMVNAGGTKPLELMITKENSHEPTDDCEFWEISVDGIYLDKIRKPSLRKSYIPPGGRRDWIVVCHEQGTYELKSEAEDIETCSIGSISRLTDLLLTINVSDSHQNPKFPPPPPLTDESLPPRQPFISDFTQLTDNQVQKGFVVELAAFFHLNRKHFEGEGHFRYKVKLESVQEWTLLNSDPNGGHPLHIHINHFQVISYNEYHGAVSRFESGSNTYYSLDGDVCTYQAEKNQEKEDNFDGIVHANETGPCIIGQKVDHIQRRNQGGPGTLAYPNIGDFHDVLYMPPLSNVTIRFEADRFTGEVVMHCHILSHEDLGMMMTVDITSDETETSGTPNDDDRAAGKCF